MSADLGTDISTSGPRCDVGIVLPVGGLWQGPGECLRA